MATWDEVSGAPEFNALPIEKKADVRNAFFDREIAPQAPKEHLDDVRKAFLSRTDESLKRTGMKVGNVAAKPESIQDSGSFWGEQAIKGIAQIPEFSGMLADVAMSPINKAVDVAKSAFGIAPKEKPASIAGDFRSALRKGGIVKDIPPTTEAQRIFAKPVEFAAGSLPFSAGNVATAAGRRGITALTEALSTVGGGMGAAEGEIAGRQLGGEGGAALGAAGGGIVGGGLSAMAVPQALKKGYGAAKSAAERALQGVTGGRKLTQEQLDKIIGPKLAQVLKADPSAAAALAESGAVTGRIPGFNPDLAAATGSTVIGAMKERVSREGENVLSRFVRLSEQNKSALDKFRETMFPKGGERPQDIARRKVSTDVADLESNYARIADQLERQRTQTDEAISALANTHVKPERAGEIGDQLLKLRDQAAEIRIAQAQAQYGPVYELADRMGWQEDISPLVSEINDLMRSGAPEFTKDKIPRVFREILQYAKRKSVEDTRKIVENEARKAGGKLPASITQYVARAGGLSRAEVGGALDKVMDAKNPRDFGKLPQGLSEGESRRLVSAGELAKSPDGMLTKLKEDGYLPPEADLNDMYQALEYEVMQARPTTFAARDQDKAYEQMMLRAQEMFTEEKGMAAAAAKDGRVMIPFRDFHELQKKINADLPSAGRATENLMKMKDWVKGKLQPYEGEGEIGTELKKANDFWLSQWKEPFQRGAGAAMRKVDPENIVQRAFLNKRERGAEDWKRIYGENPEAARLLYEGTADSFAYSAVKDGKLNLASAKTWLNKNDRFLKEFPELRMEFDTVIRGTQEATAEGAAKASALEAKLKSINEAKQELEEGIVAKVAGVEDVPALAKSAISSPKEMDAVLRLVRSNPQAKAGFAKALADVVIDHGNPEGFLLSHSDSLKKAFNDLGAGHWDNLQAIVKGEQILNRGGDPKKLGKLEMGGDPMQELLGTPSASLFSLAKGLGSWVSPQYAVFHVGGRYLFKIRADQQREFLVEMLTNPDVAKRLADTYKNVTPADAEAMARGLYNQGSREAMEQLRQMKDEVAPLLRLHGIRVTVNAANVPGREEFRKEQEGKGDAATQDAIRAQGQKRLRDLQGRGAGIGSR